MNYVNLDDSPMYIPFLGCSLELQMTHLDSYKMDWALQLGLFSVLLSQGWQSCLQQASPKMTAMGSTFSFHHSESLSSFFYLHNFHPFDLCTSCFSLVSCLFIFLMCINGPKVLNLLYEVLKKIFKDI